MAWIFKKPSLTKQRVTRSTRKPMNFKRPRRRSRRRRIVFRSTNCNRGRDVFESIRKGTN